MKIEKLLHNIYKFNSRNLVKKKGKIRSGTVIQQHNLTHISESTEKETKFCGLAKETKGNNRK